MTVPAWALMLALSTPAEAKKPIVAVFDIEARRMRMGGQLRDALRDYVETRLTASGAYEVVPSDQLKKALSKQKTRSYKQCYKQSCQISIGQELAADRTLSTRVTRIGKDCVVSMKLYHLKRMTTEKGDTKKGACSESGIMSSIDKVVRRLASGGTGNSGGPGPSIGGPRVSGGDITKPSARLIVRVRPASARIKVTGPGGYASTGGATWEQQGLTSGTYQVTAGAAGWAVARRTVTLAPDDLKTLTINLERPGTLVVTGKPAGARVEISGSGNFSVVKGLPVTVSGASRGSYTVKVTRDGYLDHQRQVSVLPGATARVQVALVPRGGQRKHCKAGEVARCARLCARGDMFSCNELGYSYQHGKGVARNYRRGVKIYRKACAGGNMAACSNLAYCYEHGKGVVRNRGRAVKLYHRACNGDNRIACYNLGSCYEFGRGAARDYRRSCDGGTLTACYNMALMFKYGRGVAKDRGKALLLFRKACAGGHKDSCRQR